jgi:ADP-ribose pyrophosphatase
VINVSWSLAEPTYAPVEFTSENVLAADRSKVKDGWADPADWTPQLQKEVSARTTNALKVGEKVLMVKGRPRNPIGRTGITGRGLLGKYGPNQAADALVTRFNETGVLQMIAVQRSDSRKWAIPGGMVDPKEIARRTACREFFEEAYTSDTEEQKELKTKLEQLFKTGGSAVYIGYVDDPRNTDISWMETMCFHFHLDDDSLARKMELKAGDDAVNVRWLDVSDADDDFKNLFASHKNMVICALSNDKTKFADTLGKFSGTGA